MKLQELTKVLVALLCIFYQQSYAQLIVQPESIALNLAANIAGDGVAISNATLTCPEEGAGIFNGLTSNIGLGSGILLTTGTVMEASGDNSESASSSGGGQPDTDLQTINASHGCDACALEFDFVPQGGTLTFNYVFASDEYPSYFCSNYNDPFGFFISGPNPLGGDYSVQNIAIIPGTSLPVSINNIGPGVCNDIDNSNLYITNSGSSVTYNGFSIVLQVNIDVIPCETYTLKLAIGDVADCSVDSGVFIQQNSLQSVGYVVNGIDISNTLIADICTSSTNLEITNGDLYSWTIEPLSGVTVISPTSYIISVSGAPQVYTLTGVFSCTSISTDITFVPIDDVVNPTIICPPSKNYVGSSVLDILLPDLPYSTSSQSISDMNSIGGFISDDCTPGNVINVTYSDEEEFLLDLILVRRTYVAFDDSGNSAECEQLIRIAPLPIPIEMSITDPCNCDNLITVDGIEYAQEIITINPGEAPYMVTSIDGLYNLDGNLYTASTATNSIISTTLTLTGYVPANGTDTYSITVEDGNGSSDNLIGGPCNSCTSCQDADNGELFFEISGGE